MNDSRENNIVRSAQVRKFNIKRVGSGKREPDEEDIRLNSAPHNRNVINPSEIKSIVKKTQNIFNGYNQQDSSEFIVCLLNIIDEEIMQSKGIEELFGIQFNVRIKCKYTECLKENIIKEYIINYIIYIFIYRAKN